MELGVISREKNIFWIRLVIKLITKYGQAFKEGIFDEAFEEVDCKFEGKVYVEKGNKSGKDEKTDNSKTIAMQNP